MMLSRKDVKLNRGSYNCKVEREPETDRMKEKLRLIGEKKRVAFILKKKINSLIIRVFEENLEISPASISQRKLLSLSNLHG